MPGPIETGGAPVIAAGGVVNAASFAPVVAKGGLATVFGSNLASTTAPAPSLPLPTTLGGTQVMVGGIAAPLVSFRRDRSISRCRSRRFPRPASAWW